MMKRLPLFFLASLFMFACSNCDTDPKDPQGENPTEDTTATTGFVRTAENFDGVNEFSQEVLDSLKMTYQFPAEDGLYFVPKHSRVTIDLLPLQIWTRMVNRREDWRSDEHPEYNWVQFHRFDHTDITCGGRPAEINEIDGGFDLFIPFDGNTSNRVKDLLAKYPEGLFTLMIDEKATSIHPLGIDIGSDGIHVKHGNRAVLDSIQTRFK
ncbi:hypothetical protein [Sanyastnella coralliicola]|uniref:hypothetical protein n=1 Tax=Sanyastnella coralliicola TaxID=3069118 RepID=UPI0027B9F12F|nr:hypothetical protein [Longitalea sp. SCSIO 12813]